VGDEIVAAASGIATRVKRIVTFDGDLNEARAPMSVTLTLEDEVDISRGDMLVRASEKQPRVAKSFEANVVWFNPLALDPARDYLLKHTTQTVPARIEKVQNRVNMETLESDALPDNDTPDNDTLNTTLKMNDIGRVSVRTALPVYIDAYRDGDRFNRATGSFILIDRETNATVAGGMIL
jgi:sulfate adenylyltransferase subunit 1 (EFTu-like GTPase family)